MVILISANSCTGKTLMSQKLLEKYKIPYYSIDHIKMGIIKANENCGFTPYDSNDVIGKKLWPMIRGIIMTSIENDQDIIIEGCYILPQFMKDFNEEYSKQIISVFFGFSKKYVEEKFESDILKYRNIIESRFYEEERPITQFVDEHLSFKEACEKNEIHYYEINNNYEKEILTVYDYIDKEVKRLKTEKTFI